MWGRLHIKTTQMTPFFCGIPLFQSFLSLYIPLSFANFLLLQKKKKKFASGVRIIVAFLFVFLFCIFFNFVCMKGHPSSDSGPSGENFMKRVQIRDDEEAKCQR